ncbi:hypothetical protein N431DRAFT_455753 [Stipitochalara longipes BDJ]|nr:hypothetical protein N431DRAFT_455753 [Stipitochalara longipes BDJ]
MAAKTGFWVDHSHNPVLGARLTLTVEDGGYLITGLTQLVALAGGAAWVIAAFAMHQYRTKPGPKDALFLQKQVILRNNTSAPADIWQFLTMGYAWKRHMPKSRQRTCLILLIPLFIWCGFIAAGVFVTKLTTPGYEVNNVLLKSGTCGFVDFDFSTQNGLLAGFNKIANDTSQARAYAQRCCSASTSTSGCSSLPIKSINYTTNTAASCPWNGDRCVLGSFGAFEMDSGWIDSHIDLGINAKPSDRVQVGMVNTCSVIHYGDLIKIIPDNTTTGLSDFYQFYLGPLQAVSNYTYQYSTHTVNDLVAYTLTVTYFSPTDDPFFSASGNFTAADGNIAPDNYVHIMACTDQRQFRNPHTNASTILTGLYNTGYSALGFNVAQTATVERIFLALSFCDTYNTVNGQNSAALQATSKLYQLFSPGLPNNQWQLELQGWFETGLAKFQQYIVDFVDNPTIGDADGLISITAPADWDESDRFALEAQCSQQRVQSTGSYQYFSFLGIIVIIVIAPTIIILSWFLPGCVNRRKDRRDREKNVGKRYAYIADGKLNLLRMALEGRGYDKWEEAMSDIPVRKEEWGTFMPVHKEEETLLYPRFGERGRDVDNGVLNGGGQRVGGDPTNGSVRSNAAQHVEIRGGNRDRDDGIELDEI